MPQVPGFHRSSGTPNTSHREEDHCHHLEAAQAGQQPEGEEGDQGAETANRHFKPKQTGHDDFKPFQNCKQKPPALQPLSNTMPYSQ